MAFNIPSNPITNPAEGLAATAPSPETMGAAAAGPYNVATAAVAGLAQLNQTREKYQKLDNEALIASVAGEIDVAARDIRNAQRENPEMEVDGQKVNTFSFVNDNPALGTHGRNAFQTDINEVVESRLSTMTSSQKRQARPVLTDLVNKHTVALQEDQFVHQKEFTAAKGVESIQSLTAAGNWKDATSRNHQQFLNGAYSQETYQALRKYIASEEFQGFVTDFISKPPNDTTMAAAVAEAVAWKNPLITEDDKAQAIGVIYQSHEKGRVDQQRNLGLMQAKNEIELMRVIGDGKATAAMITNAGLANVISRESVPALLSMIKDRSEGKTDPAEFMRIQLGLAQAQDMSQKAQLAAKAEMKGEVYAAFNDGLLSKTDFNQTLELANKLGSGTWSTPGYKEAVGRGLMLIGAQAPITGPDGQVDFALMLGQMASNSKDSAAQGARMKMDLDAYLLDVPTDEVPQKAMDWVINNASRYAKGEPAVADLTAAVRARISPYMKADGTLTKTRQAILNDLSDQAIARTITIEEHDAQVDEINKYFDERAAADQRKQEAARARDEAKDQAAESIN
jgi:hypothetical protein